MGKKKGKAPPASELLYPDWHNLHKPFESIVRDALEACKDPIVEVDTPCKETAESSVLQWKEGIVLHNPSQHVARVSREGPAACLPPNSAILAGDAREWGKAIPAMRRHSWLIADPPWMSHSAARRRAYRTMAKGGKGHCETAPPLGMEDIRDLPVAEWVAPRGAVAVWVTNAVKVVDYVLRVCFPKWGVEYKQLLVWVKVKPSGEPLHPIDSSHRKTYEMCLMGTMAGTPAHEAAESERDAVDGVALAEELLRVKVVPHVGVVREHSRKPDISYALRALCEVHEDGISALELFGRKATTGWLVAGNEPLLFNEIAEQPVPEPPAKKRRAEVDSQD